MTHQKHNCFMLYKMSCIIITACFIRDFPIQFMLRLRFWENYKTKQNAITKANGNLLYFKRAIAVIKRNWKQKPRQYWGSTYLINEWNIDLYIHTINKPTTVLQTYKNTNLSSNYTNVQKIICDSNNCSAWLQKTARSGQSILLSCEK